MAYFWRFYLTLPYVALALTVLTFVRACGLGRRAQIVWTVALLFCHLKYVVYRFCGGDVLFPELPEALIVLWDGAYLGALALAALALPLAFWKARAKAVVLPLVAWGVIVLGLWNGRCAPGVREIELAYPDLPAALDGYRILQISDLHASCAARRSRTEEVVARANALHPDLICFTGDFVDGRPEVCADFLEPITRLRARDGVWSVTGNHEFIGDVNPVAAWRAVYARWGVRFLANACVFPHPGLALGGTDDFWTEEAAPDVGRTFAAATNGEFRVLMQHQPRAAVENLRGHGVRLQLSGHTHGGFMPGLAVLVRQVNAGFLRGLYRIGDGVLYVSCGAGPWGGMPLRYFTPSEITLFTLRRRPSSRP